MFGVEQIHLLHLPPTRGLWQGVVRITLQAHHLVQREWRKYISLLLLPLFVLLVLGWAGKFGRRWGVVVMVIDARIVLCDHANDT
jgi:hypothetical protein